MMLAGLPASGKSTLLRQALADGAAPFGEEARAAFLKTRPPPAATEDTLSLEQRLQNGYWLQDHDLIQLHLKSIRPSRMVVHFDLFWMLRAGCFYLRRENDTGTWPGFAAFLADDAGVEELFRGVFGLLPLAGSRIILKILKPAYAVSCQRWAFRLQQSASDPADPWIAFVSSHLYHERSDGELLYERTYANWQRALSQAVSA